MRLTIAVGSEADIRVMKRISQYGGGLFHYTLNPSTLPQIVLQQLDDKPKDEPPRDRDFTPVQERGSELLASFPGKFYPSVRGYMETDLKRGAHLDLTILREDGKAPLLASWRYGRGKTIALTTDLEGRWSRNWIQWNDLQNFWTRIFDWLRPGPSEQPIPLHEARVSLSASQPILDLFLYEEASADSQFRFSTVGKSGKSEGTPRNWHPVIIKPRCRSQLPGTTVSNLARSGAAGE
jgi:Putative glutamine amidotransferase